MYIVGFITGLLGASIVWSYAYTALDQVWSEMYEHMYSELYNIIERRCNDADL